MLELNCGRLRQLIAFSVVPQFLNHRQAIEFLLKFSDAQQSLINCRNIVFYVLLEHCDGLTLHKHAESVNASARALVDATDEFFFSALQSSNVAHSTFAELVQLQIKSSECALVFFLCLEELDGLRSPHAFSVTGDFSCFRVSQEEAVVVFVLEDAYATQ